MQIIELNHPGNVVHTTGVEKLADIVKYGLVSRYHYSDVKGLADTYPRLRNCPCGQNLDQKTIDRLNYRGLLFFHVIGAEYNNGGRVSVERLWAPILGSSFGILIQPEDFFVGVPERKDFEFKAFMGDADALEQRGIKDYWEYLSREASWRGRGTHDLGEWEFRVPSCVPWQKFSALVVPSEKDAQATRKKVIATIGALPKQLRKPIYDKDNNLLFSPN